MIIAKDKYVAIKESIDTLINNSALPDNTVESISDELFTSFDVLNLKIRSYNKITKQIKNIHSICYDIIELYEKTNIIMTYHKKIELGDDESSDEDTEDDESEQDEDEESDSEQDNEESESEQEAESEDSAQEAALDVPESEEADEDAAEYDILN